MYLPRARAILAQCFEHGHWRLGLSGTRLKTEREREEGERREQGGGSSEAEYILCVFKTEKWTICMMFNAGGSGQGSECVSFTSHLTHLQSSPHK